MNKRNLGKFLIGDVLFDDGFDFVKMVMREMVVVRAELMINCNAIEYTAISDRFRELKDGESVPFYDIIFTEYGARISENKNRYTLNSSEFEMLVRFRFAHRFSCDANCSTEFTETGIGTNIKVQCDGCHEVKDITDYSCW